MTRIDQLRAALEERILVLDGAMGTALQALELSAADFGGAEFEGCNEHLNLTRPDVVQKIHEAYLAAGCDIVETNTFGSTALVLAEYPPLDQKAYEITRRGAELARAAADAYSTPQRLRFVAGAMGPTTKAISVTGGVTFAQLTETYYDQARALMDGGCDYLLLETSQDTRNVKAGLIAVQKLSEALGREVPVAVSGTIEPMGTMLGGQSVEALITSITHVKLLYIGLNCATGPEFMTDHLRALSELAPTYTACVPNAGLPDETGTYLETPGTIARVMRRFLEEGWLNLIGGCCGTTPAHIAELVKLAAGAPPRRPQVEAKTRVSGIEALEIDESTRPILVGERTNVIGSRLFKELIVAEKFEEASEIARRQVKGGAHVIDVCLANPDRDETADMEAFLSQVINKVKVPLMIDSTDPGVIERALTYCQGKALINSINLEDGEERFAAVVPLARRFGAALIVGTIDEDPQAGMAVTRERKVAIARRSFDLLTQKYGVPPEDIIFDPLVFPCATGDQNYLGSARETIEGIRLIKAALPATKTILGISNVSFGLPPAGREVLNAVFLYHCVQAGLDLAIVNSEKLERYATLPEEERALADALLFATTDESIARFADHFRAARQRESTPKAQRSLDERLAHYIIEGSKDGLVDDLQAKLAEGADPLAIINGPLMAGMDEVGRLFGNNELIVAEVLQSAEAMKAAVAFLEPLMEKGATNKKGRIILATVKGDVHDIGKNLVEIILANNGYEVINLGIKVPPAELIEAIKRHRPDIVGLSGLLVKSTQQMVITAEELTAAGVTPPMLVGGAALSNAFTHRQIAPAYGNLVAYAQDAMKGLELANRIVDPPRRAELAAELAAKSAELAKAAERKAGAAAVVRTRSAEVPVLEEVPRPPDFEPHVLRRINLDEVWSYINPSMLYTRHLGLRGGRADELLAKGDEKALMLVRVVDELKARARAGAMQVAAVWRFFEAASDGEAIHLFAPGGETPLATFGFPRQQDGKGLCLADYVRPLGKGSAAGGRDALCLFVTTAGAGIRAQYEAYREQGEYLYSHAVQALAIETAEATAEWLHKKIRGLWGFPDDPRLTLKDLIQTHYRGRRYSFGYPACPDLALQAPLWRLLQPEQIGVELTDEYMMEPEASVSALVLHHPACEYFTA